MTTCAMCGRPINLDDETNYYEVAGWVSGPKLDGMKLRRKTDLVAHADCVKRVEAGQAADQPELFDDNE